jgi:predicted hydrocarbon binding protein
MNSAPIRLYPNSMGRVLILAMEEILGPDEMKHVPGLARFLEYCDQNSSFDPDLKFKFCNIGQLQVAIEHAYGLQGGRGLSQRVGRACFKYSLRQFGPGLGVTDLSFHLLPFPSKLKVGSEALTIYFNHFFDQQINFDMDETHIHLHFESCPLSGSKQFDGPCCAFFVGFLQEALYWVSGGKFFLINEKNCIAHGDTECTIVIDKTPIS